MDYLYYTYKYLAQGGVIIIPLAGVSFVMWWFIFERLRFFSDLEKNDIDLYIAVKMIQKQKLPIRETGLRARIVGEIVKQKTGRSRLDKSIAERETMRLRMGIVKNIPLIAVFAAVAPLFGLLGTITGMITTFDVISVFGTGNASALAGGISEALITTQCGLFVAIPGLLMCVYISRRAASLENRIDETLVTLKRYL